MKLIVLALSLIALRTSAFAPVEIGSGSSIRTNVQALCLVPSQGCQLAAASAAALAKLEEEREEMKESTITSRSTSSSSDSSAQNLRPSDATREFVSRLFHLPPFASKSQATEQFASDRKAPNDKNHYHDDVVLYPIVGFQYVKLQDGSTRGIPTMNLSPEKAACNFSAKRMSEEQPLHGWFSECCMLGNLFATDDEYCGNARFLELEERKKNSI